jgi:hypothetical protein
MCTLSVQHLIDIGHKIPLIILFSEVLENA